MTDDLDQLRRSLQAATPPADPARRQADLTLAMKNFDTLQETAAAARQKPDRASWAGILTGVTKMLKTLSTRIGLAATTSVAALTVALVLAAPMLTQRPGPIVLRSDEVTQTPAAPKMAAKEKAPATAMTRGLVAEGETDALAREAPALAEATAPLSSDAGAAAPLADQAVAMAEPEPAPTQALPPDTEAYANAPANPVHVTAEDPVSTFSVDVDTASYSVVRASLNAGSLPPPDAVRIEEMVNYFPYAYPAPEGDQPFASTVSVMPSPWTPGAELVRIGLQGRLPAMADRPALNLVFLIDTSGSMEDANKLPLLRQSLRLMLGQLRPEDRIAIVTYAGSAGQVLAPTPASERATIEAALNRLDAGGATAGAEGLALAYQVAGSMGGDGHVSRILLATDGDFNVGVADPQALKDMVATQRKSGIYLSVLGFGRGNLDDATMQALAQNGNGTASNIDTLSEAQKVLGDQLTGALFPIADDVKVQVEWNPARVAEYRLIGYETRALRRQDFNNDKVDAGEIGAGLQVTALYEITPPGSPALKTDALRYAPPVATNDTGEIGFLRLRWKAPGDTASQLAETLITGREPADDETHFAAAMAGFGQLLRGGRDLGDWGWDQAIALAVSSKGADPFGYRAEAVGLMRLAKSLSAE